MRVAIATTFLVEMQASIVDRPFCYGRASDNRRGIGAPADLGNRTLPARTVADTMLGLPKRPSLRKRLQKDLPMPMQTLLHVYVPFVSPVTERR